MTCRIDLRSIALCVTLVAGACAQLGCDALGAASYLAFGPEKVPAMVELERGRKTVVFIDDRYSVAPTRPIRQLIGTTAEQRLVENAGLDPAQLVSSITASQVAQQERFGEPMSVPEIAEAVGADIVIFVTIDEFSMSPDGSSFKPEAHMRVSVVDAAADERLWPDTTSRYRLIASPNVRRLNPPQTIGEARRVERQIATEAGEAIAKLFYAHAGREVSELLGREE